MRARWDFAWREVVSHFAGFVNLGRTAHTLSNFSTRQSNASRGVRAFFPRLGPGLLSFPAAAGQFLSGSLPLKPRSRFFTQLGSERGAAGFPPALAGRAVPFAPA